MQAFRLLSLYLPEDWTQIDPDRLEATKVPTEIQFQTNLNSLEQIRQAVASEVAPGVVLADAGYESNGPFRPQAY